MSLFARLGSAWPLFRIERQPTPRRFVRWLWAGNLLVIAILLTLAGSILVQTRAEHHEQAAVDTRNMALLLEQNLNALIEKTDVSLQTIAREIGRQAAQGKLHSDRLNEMLSEQKSLLPEVAGLRISDAEGMTICGESDIAAKRVSIADQAFFTQARDNSQAGLVIEGPIRSRISGKWIIVLARRVNYPDGRFLGVVGAAIETEHFRRLFSSMHLGGHGSVIMRNADHRLITRFAPEEREPDVGSDRVTPIYAKAVSTHPKTGDFLASSPFDGVERTVSYRRVGDYPLYVIVGLGTEDYLGTWHGEAVRTAVFIGLAILIMTFSSWRIYLSWRRQMESEERFRRMVEAVRDYAVFAIDTEGRVTTWNEGAHHLTGYQADEIIGAPYARFFTVADVGRGLPAERLETVRQKGSLASEGWRTCKDGTPFMASEVITALADASGKAQGFTIILRDITHQRRAEQAAEKAHTLLRDAVNSIATGFVIYDPEDRLVICNEAYRRLFNPIRELIVPGAKYEDLIRASMRQGLFPEAKTRDEDWVRERIRQHRMADGRPTEQTFHGGLRLLILKYRTSSGHIVANYIDITELQRHREHLEQLVEARTAELKASMAQFRILIEQAPSAMAMLDRNLNYLTASRRWIDEYGGGLRQLTGRNHYELYPDLPERWRTAHQSALAGIPQKNDQDQWIHADGRRQWLRWAVCPWMEEHGAIGGLIISCEDITGRKLAEEQLQESETRFRSTFEQAAVGIAHVAPDYTFLRVNEKLCAIVGYEREELQRLSFPDITHPGDLDTDLESARQLLGGTIQSYSMEKRYIRKDGSLVWINLTGSLVRKPTGEPDYFVAVVEDIQLRKETELTLEAERQAYQRHLEQQVSERTADLVAANRELQGFTYAASHDMRAPLVRINSFSTLLEKNYRERLEGDGLMFLDIIRSNATRIMALVDDLLAHAQIEQKILHSQAVDVQAAVRVIVNEREAEIREGGVELRMNLSPAQVATNPHGLAQVLRNLVENAIKYSSREKSPIIDIGGREQDGSYRLWVRDNGVGFDMMYHDRIFEIFRRLHTYEEFPGSGIGLALVKKAMERMGGSVWAESAPNQGATFFLELPLAQAPMPETDAAIA